MAIINIDMEGVAEGGGSFDPVEPGIYGAKVLSVDLKGPGPSGSKYFEFMFELLETDGRRVWRNYSLSPKALPWLKGDLVKLGIEVPEGMFEFDTEEVIGKTCRLKLSLKPAYRGGVNDDGTPKMDNEVDELLVDDGEFAWS